MGNASSWQVSWLTQFTETNALESNLLKCQLSYQLLRKQVLLLVIEHKMNTPKFTKHKHEDKAYVILVRLSETRVSIVCIKSIHVWKIDQQKEKIWRPEQVILHYVTSACE